MAKKANVFTDEWNAFHSVGVDLAHLAHLLPWQLNMARNATQRSLEVVEKMGHTGRFGAGTGLTIIDIFRKGDFTYRMPAGKRSTQGDDIDPMLREVEGRFHNSVLLSLHEALEVYVKKLYERMLFQSRNDHPLRGKSDFYAAIKNAHKHKGTPEYYHQYVRWACKRDCRWAWDAFRNKLDWGIVKQEHWRGMNWITVVETLSLCRNFIAHNEGRIAAERWTEMSRPQQQFIRSLMRESMLTDEERILAGKDQMYCFLEAIMAVGYGIYILLSRQFNMNIDVKLGAIQFTPNN